MRRATRVPELLAFDLALRGRWITDLPESARPCDAPSSWTHAAQAGALLAGFDEAGRGALAGPIVVGCVAFPGELLDQPERVVGLLAEVDDSKALSPKARERAFAAIASSASWSFGCASAREIDRLGIVSAAELGARRAYCRLGIACTLAVFDRGLSMGTKVALDPSSLSPLSPWSSLGSLSSLSCRGDRCLVPGRSAGTPICDEESEPKEPTRLNRLHKPNELNKPSKPNELNRLNVPPGVAFTKGDTRSLHVAAASLVAKVTRDHLLERLDRAVPGYEFAQHKGYGTEVHRRLIARRGPSPLHRLTFLHPIDGADTQSC